MTRQPPHPELEQRGVTKDGRLTPEGRNLINDARLAAFKARREEMIRWLIAEQGFNSAGAAKAVDAFLDSIEYIYRTPGTLLDAPFPSPRGPRQ
jgi:hypothetical protein